MDNLQGLGLFLILLAVTRCNFGDFRWLFLGAGRRCSHAPFLAQIWPLWGVYGALGFVGAGGDAVALRAPRKLLIRRRS